MYKNIISRYCEINCTHQKLPKNKTIQNEIFFRIVHYKNNFMKKMLMKQLKRTCSAVMLTAELVKYDV